MADNIWDAATPPSNNNPPQQAALVEKTVSPVAVQTTLDESIQARSDSRGDQIGFSFLNSLVTAGMLLPPWWSAARDIELRNFWKRGDHISGAMNAMITRMTTIPFHVEPRDETIARHQRLAVEWDVKLHEWVEYGGGWIRFFSPSLEDLLGTDNGWFFEIIDDGDEKVGPISGNILTVSHLDSTRCIRTGDPEFPVVFHDMKGPHKLHWTRVAFTSQLSSANQDMYGVGFSAVSRSIHNAQHLIDIANYQEEKLGSRPLRALMLANNIDPATIDLAVQTSQMLMTDRGLTRFSQIPIIGGPGVRDASIDLIDLATLPDGFDQQTSTTLAMAGMALAFGVDARELFPAMSVGATKADALLSHLKQRGKGPGQIIAQTEQLFNMKVLPNVLKLVFDFQDDAQDKQRADISNTRSTTRVNNLDVGVTTTRVEREKMVADREITKEQFVQMELNSGRLEDGRDVLTLFFDQGRLFATLLNLGVQNPLMIEENDPDTIIPTINANIEAAQRLIAGGRPREQKEARQALAALEKLKGQYEGEDPEPEPRPTVTPEEAPEGDESTQLAFPLNIEETELEEVKGDIMKLINRKKEMSAAEQLTDAVERVVKENTVQPIIFDPHIDIHVPEQPVPKVTVINEAPVQKELPLVINVPEQAAPVVNIEPAAVKVKVEAAKAPEVKVEVRLPDEEETQVERDSKGILRSLKKTRKYKDS